MAFNGLDNFILKHFPAGSMSNRIAIVLDPNNLLIDDLICLTLLDRGYRIEEFSNTFVLRAVYEREIRNKVDSKLIIVFHQGEDYLEVVPYDLRRLAGVPIDLSVDKLFPNFDFSTLKTLDVVQLKAFFEKLYLAGYKSYNEEDTCEFLLEKVYGISASAITDNESLLEALVKIHVDLQIKSPQVLQYLKKEICAREDFPSATYGGIILSSDSFLAFVQKEWDICLTVLKENGVIITNKKPKGYLLLDFRNERVRSQLEHLVDVGQLTGDGTLESLEAQLLYFSHKRKLQAGEALEQFFAIEEEKLETLKSYRDWLNFAKEWGEFENLVLRDGHNIKKFKYLQEKVNEEFYRWLMEHYVDLSTIPSKDFPVMVHHTWKILSRLLQEDKKVALIVVDGLALNQWIVLRQHLKKFFSIREYTSFAWLPTLTSISRQSIFSGKQPFEFESSISNTNNEKKAWQQLWLDAGLGLEKKDIFYDRNWGTKGPSPTMELAAVSRTVKVCGIVVNSVDDMMHGEKLGAGNFLQQIESWAKSEYLKMLLSGLQAKGFEIFLTSDHGNIGCVGAGKLADGVLVEQKGERVRFYKNETLMMVAEEGIDGVKHWTPIGLPPNLHPLFSAANTSFLEKGEFAVSHGGPSIEEVIVPFIQICQKGEMI